MKKITSLLVMFLMVAATAMARDRVSRDINSLPDAARQVINTHFKGKGVNHIKIDDKTFGGAEYDVVLNDGTEIDFDSKGNIKEIDCGKNPVPDALILKPIKDYVAKNFKGQKIVGMEVNRNNYEVQLSGGMELKFDRAGNFLRVDN
ncbi:MAG: PepSY-like domain-containing protein [Muribaculaceae bacterium]|nr:PepSY-like domain-containing protein [Muribaculaceae bacterium]